MNDALFIALQRLTPQHTLSRLAGALANCTTPWIKNTFISWFANKYDIDMTLAAEPDPLAYPSFNAFFTRALKADARPVCTESNAIVCPADGSISQAGKIQAGRIFQAKGQSFTVQELLGGDPQISATYENGQFATVYLSPRDYHRVHMPAAATLTSMVHVPGELFSVNKVTAEGVPRLFARNERVVCHFDSPHGPMAVVLVGAMIVASIETVWAGLITPIRKQIRTTDYGQSSGPTLAQGEEMGRFLLGSTVIVLFPENTMQWHAELQADIKVQMGQMIGHWLPASQ